MFAKRVRSRLIVLCTGSARIETLCSYRRLALCCSRVRVLLCSSSDSCFEAYLPIYKKGVQVFVLFMCCTMLSKKRRNKVDVALVAKQVVGYGGE